MFGNIMKKINKALCVGLSALTLAGATLAFSACTSATPKVTVTVKFNEKTYALSYKLYRDYFPQTVQHFLELADAGYYNGLCFHDYADEGMYTGAYSYADGALEEKDYNAFVGGMKKFTQTVFASVPSGQEPAADTGLNTVVGEFESNNFIIENNANKYGAKKNGSLVMYYLPLDTNNEKYVTVRRNTKEENVAGNGAWYRTAEYVKNSATSVFYMSFSSSSTVDKDHAVFGDLYDENATSEFNALRAAIREYIENNFDEAEDFTTETTQAVNDLYYGLQKMTYDVPTAPIVIESVKVNRH